MFAAPPRYYLTRMTDCGVNFLNTSNIIFVAIHRVTHYSLPTISSVTLLERGTLLRARFHLRYERVEDCANVCCTSSMRPHFLHNDANYGVNFLNTTTYVSLLSVGCAWFVSRLYHTFIARTNPKVLRGIARALSESTLQLPKCYPHASRIARLFATVSQAQHRAIFWYDGTGAFDFK